MRAAGRFGVYAVLGWGIEVCFTAVKDLATGVGDNRLRGESYVWMAPIYGIGGLAGETVHRSLRGRPVWERAAAYALTFWAVEASTGEALRRVLGDVPWGESYRGHPDELGDGLIRLAWAPNWAAAGLALEIVEPFVRRLQLAPADH
jgi:uncharacterized membrane protein